MSIPDVPSRRDNEPPGVVVASWLRGPGIGHGERVEGIGHGERAEVEGAHDDEQRCRTKAQLANWTEMITPPKYVLSWSERRLAHKTQQSYLLSRVLRLLAGPILRALDPLKAVFARVVSELLGQSVFSALVRFFRRENKVLADLVELRRLREAQDARDMVWEWPVSGLEHIGDVS
eukprot:gnl/Spiro4/5608_TR2855_c0_g1_i1.p1 gnl/Spiro4/5608_TR2855_c0_g1~~gnl/Spiro4/5608_TR2855_c0_g1_i1.p1  ORF type:complete len:176 (+),score=35.27 gnl/Spiro4/5608_TR2855_c0_g1_i1:50-577(+)